MENGSNRLAVVFGILALVNSKCTLHSNCLPHRALGLLVLGFSTALADEDYRGMTAGQAGLRAGEEISYFYADDYSDKLPCGDCYTSGAARKAQYRKSTSARERSTRQAVAARASESLAPRPCNGPGALTLYPEHAKPLKPRLDCKTPSPGGHILPAVGKGPLTRTFDFTLASFNAHARLAGSRFDKTLGEIMFQMQRHAISVLGIQETGRDTLEGVYADTSGVGERILIDPSGKQHRFLALWASPRECRRSRTGGTGVGTALIWDACIPYIQPYRSTSGRVCAVTLVGPEGTGTRVINVYGVASPSKLGDGSLEAQTKKELCRQVRDELAQAIVLSASKGWLTVVLGDFNEVPDATLDKVSRSAASKAKPEFSLIDLMKTHGLQDTFRMAHPKARAYSFFGVGCAKPARLDAIWSNRHMLRGGHFRAGIDATQAILGLSDHALVHFSVTFYRALHAPRNKVLWDMVPLAHLTLPQHKLEEDETRSIFRSKVEELAGNIIAETLKWAQITKEWDDWQTLVTEDPDAPQPDTPPPTHPEILTSWAALEQHIVKAAEFAITPLPGTSALKQPTVRKGAGTLGPFQLTLRALRACNRVIRALNGSFSSARPLKAAWKFLAKAWPALCKLLPKLQPNLPELPKGRERANENWHTQTRAIMTHTIQHIDLDWKQSTAREIRRCISARNSNMEDGILSSKPMGWLHSRSARQPRGKGG